MSHYGDQGFRVVIVGGSIAGLSLALALERSGIDFVVLEAHPTIAPQVGASIAVLPSGARILDQLGCYDDVASLVNCSIDNFIIRDAGGQELIRVENLEEHLVQRHGYPMIFFERRMVIDVLYKHIRRKEKILTSRRVVDLEMDEHGVSVKCQDGSVQQGSILVGADGIRSTVARQILRLSGSAKKGKWVSRIAPVALVIIPVSGPVLSAPPCLLEAKCLVNSERLDPYPLELCPDRLFSQVLESKLDPSLYSRFFPQGRSRLVVHMVNNVLGPWLMKNLPELPVRYRCLFGISDMVPGIAEDTMHHVTNYASSLFASSGPNDRTYWCLFTDLGDTYYGDALPPWGEEEEAEIVRVHGLDAVTETVHFSDLYERRITSVSTPLHEGVLEKWYEGRCIVVGDAVHKFNPIIGLGGVSALETTATLTNTLVALVKSSPNPSRLEIETAFAKVQDARQPRAKALVDASNQTQSRFAMETPWLRFMNRHFYPAQGPRPALRLLSEAYPGTQSFDSTAAAQVKAPAIKSGATRPAWLPAVPAFRALPYEDELLRPPTPRAAFVSLAITAVLVGLGFLGVHLLLQTSLANGTFRLVDEAVWQRSVEVPGKGIVDLRALFGPGSPVSALNELLTTLVAVFLPLVAEQVTGVSSLERKLHAGYFLVAVFLPILAVMLVEGSRSRNTWSLVWSPSAWLTLAQLFGLGLILPFYVLDFFLSSSKAAYWMPAERFVPERFSRAVLPALVLGFLAPSALMITPLVYAGAEGYIQQIIAFWQVSPVLASWLAEAIARCLAPSTAADKRTPLEDYSGLDIRHLNRLYGVVFFMAASTHAAVMLAVVWVVQLSVAGIFLPHQTEGPVASILEGVGIFIKYDLLLTVAGTLVWCVINLTEMKRVGLVEGSTLKRVGWLVAGCAAVGPGATLVGLWKWRERRTARPALRAAGRG